MEVIKTGEKVRKWKKEMLKKSIVVEDGKWRWRRTMGDCGGGGGGGVVGISALGSPPY